MNNQEKIKKLINELNFLFSSNKDLEQILTKGENTLEDLRLLFKKDRNLFAIETIHKLEIYSQALNLLSLIVEIKNDIGSLKSQEEIIDYLEIMDDFQNLFVYSELNHKRIDTIKRSLMSHYPKLPSLDNIRKTKELKRSFGSKFEINNLNNDEHDLFEILKVLRTGLSQERQVPPFIIATNATLIDMAIKKPRYKSDLKEVYRVRDHFINEFGDRFIKEINKYLNH